MPLFLILMDSFIYNLADINIKALLYCFINKRSFITTVKCFANWLNLMRTATLLATIPERLTNSSSLDTESRQPRRWQVESLRIDHGSVTVVGTSHTKKTARTFSESMPSS